MIHENTGFDAENNSKLRELARSPEKEQRTNAREVLKEQVYTSQHSYMCIHFIIQCTVFIKYTYQPSVQTCI
jgi:hypothetical protein